MKIALPLIGAGALIATLGGAAAQTAFTTPVGYHTETVSQGFNVIGVNLVDAPLVSSALTGVAGDTLTDANANFAESLPAGSLYSIEFESGAWSTITETTATTVKTADALNVAADDSYIIRKVRTLADYFGADNSAGFLEGTATTADVIWIPNGPNAFALAYFAAADAFLGTPAQWQVIGEAGDQANFPIPFTAGLTVQKRGEGDLDLVFTGHVKLTPTNVDIDSDFTYVSRVYPAGVTLGNSGYGDGFNRGTATSATVLWSAAGAPGEFSLAYFAAADAFLGTEERWEIIGAAGDQAEAPLSSGVIVQRRQDAFSVTLTPPAFYADL